MKHHHLKLTFVTLVIITITCPPSTFANEGANACDTYGYQCKSGSTCVSDPHDPSRRSFSCKCPSGLKGKFCEKDIDECSTGSGCLNGATCINSHGSHSCICVNGWTGTHCEANIDDCAQATCFNGATCHDRVGFFVCECPPGKTGLLCQLDDACISNPCQAAGSVCDTNPTNGSFTCSCPPGFQGNDCSEDIDECNTRQFMANNHIQANSHYNDRYSNRPWSRMNHSIVHSSSNPCEHDGVCINTIGSFTCKCPVGYTGPRCESNINECEHNPCLNEGTCLDEPGYYRCLCMPGFSGDRCESEVDECATNPCHNNGICTDQVNGFKCTCMRGFTGPTCEEDIDDCNPNPCQNRGICQDSLDAYTCQCLSGYNGVNCEININDCANDPCRNGATCIDGINTFECKCPIGFTGILCQNVVNECLSSPCMFGGTCVDLVGQVVGSNQTGLNSQQQQRAQLHVVLDGNNKGYRCECPPGTTGPRCETNLNECWSNPCFNGGTCTDLINGFRCNCKEGFTGPTCSLDVDECQFSPCMNGATCMNESPGFKCICPSSFYGKTCTKDKNDCLSNPCGNHGRCIDHPGHGHFSCVCEAEYTGQRCESKTEINECNSNPCAHGSHCIPRPSPGGHTALNGVNKLIPSYQGPGFQCACRPGYTGPRCETNINECSTNPCMNGGTCLDGVNGFTCLCPLPFSGVRCDIHMDPCLVNNCTGRSRCLPSSDLKNYTCLCDPGFTGPTCSVDIDECSRAPPLSAHLSRSRGSSLMRRTEVLCLNGGECQNNIGSFTCKCPRGFTGSRCEVDIDECESAGEGVCLNGGTCLDYIASFKCLCPQGFGGNHCERKVEACSSSPCLNDGTCHSSGPWGSSYVCKCPSGFSGKICQYNDDDCTVNSCLNGGVCKDGINSFTCECPEGYGGENCQYKHNMNPAGTTTTVCRGFDVRDTMSLMNSGFENKCLQSDPWRECPLASECVSLFGNGICDPQCNSRGCLFDGMDCYGKRHGGSGPDYDDPDDNGKCNELYDNYCLSNYANGYCDQGCNNKECGWDGLDCVDNKTHSAAALPGTVTIGTDTPFTTIETATRIFLAQFLRSLSSVVKGTVFELKNVRKDENTNNAVLELSVNQATCDRGEECFKSVIEVEEYLGALHSTKSMFSHNLPGTPLRITSVRAVDPSFVDSGTDSGNPQNLSLTVILSVGFALVIAGVILGVLYSSSGLGSPGYGTSFVGKIRKQKGITWFPEGFPKPSSSERRHASAAGRAAGGDFSSRRPRTGLSHDGHEMNSLSSSTQLMHKEGNSSPLAHEQKHVIDSIYDEPVMDQRSWSVQHMDAFQGRGIPMSPPLYESMNGPTGTIKRPSLSSPPPHTQENIYGTHLVNSPYGPCSPSGPGVDVRGPGGLTPLMVAAAYDSQTMFCQQPIHLPNNFPASPSALLDTEGLPTSPGGPNSNDKIGELIGAGASTSNQTETDGETPLHMAARMSRADAAKRLLEAGANCNATDFKGRTPLHAAVATDARGVFEILLRNRATNLNSQDDLGFTPLILAAKYSLREILEDLVMAEAQLDLQDYRGKTAVHWAASVNNASALRTLIQAGANRDAQDNLEQTPLFLAARDGAKESIEVLLELGANRDITDHMDKLPRDVAQEQHHMDIVQLLDEAPNNSLLSSQSFQNPYPQHHLIQHHHQQQMQHQQQQHQQEHPVQTMTLGRNQKVKSGTRRPSCSSSSSDPDPLLHDVKPSKRQAISRSKSIGNSQSAHHRSRSMPRNILQTTPIQTNLPSMAPATQTTMTQHQHQLLLLSPPSSSSSPLSSTFSPSASSSSPSPFSNHVLSPPHVSNMSTGFGGGQPHMHHYSMYPHHHEGMTSVPPPAYEESVFTAADPVTHYFTNLQHQVSNNTYNAYNPYDSTVDSYLTPSPDSPETHGLNGSGAINNTFSPDPTPRINDWTSSGGPTPAGVNGQDLLTPTPSQQSVFI